MSGMPERLPYEKLPRDVRAMLDDPGRPVPMTEAEKWPILNAIYEQSEAVQRLRRLQTKDADGRWEQHSDEEWAALNEWGYQQLRLAGYDPGPAPSRSGGVRYEDLVYNGIYDVLTREARLNEASFRADDAAAAREEQADRLVESVPADGPGVGYDELEALWNLKRRATEKWASRLVAEERLRSETTPSERGGTRRRVFWRVEPSTPEVEA